MLSPTNNDIIISHQILQTKATETNSILNYYYELNVSYICIRGNPPLPCTTGRTAAQVIIKENLMHLLRARMRRRQLNLSYDVARNRTGDAGEYSVREYF